MKTPPHLEHELDLVIERKEQLTQDVARLTLCHADGEALPAWQPGAHVDLVFGDDLVRQYSLCGDPDDLSVLQVAVLRELAGRGGSLVVHDKLADGDVVRVRGPRNHFPLVEADRYLFIAGGIGITPILPMIGRVEASGAEWKLLYGGRTRQSMAFRGDLEQRYPDNVAVRPQDEAGLLDLSALLAEPGATATELAMYCCGPESLLSAVEEQCANWPNGALHVERFAPKEGVGGRPSEQFEVELARTGTTLAVPADRSILEVVEDEGVDVFSSCWEGVCGTCATAVLAGIPDHRDSMLTKEEQAAGDTMMICVSRSRSPRLVLDL